MNIKIEIRDAKTTGNARWQQRGVRRLGWICHVTLNWITAPIVIPIVAVWCVITNTPVEIFWEGLGCYLRGEI